MMKSIEDYISEGQAVLGAIAWTKEPEEGVVPEDRIAAATAWATAVDDYAANMNASDREAFQDGQVYATVPGQLMWPAWWDATRHGHYPDLLRRVAAQLDGLQRVQERGAVR